MGPCENLAIVQIFTAINALFFLAKVILPIIVIVSGMVTFGKYAVSSSPEALSKGLTTIFRSVIAVVIVFLIPIIVPIIYGIATDYDVASSMCLLEVDSNTVKRLKFVDAERSVGKAVMDATKINYETALAKVKLLPEENNKSELLNRLKIAEAEIERKSKLTKEERLKEIAKEAEIFEQNFSNGNTDIGAGKLYPGQKFSLTELELKKIAAGCIAENGTAERAVKFEASLVANITDTGSYGSNPLKVMYSSWFASDTHDAMDAVSSGSSVNSNAVEWVRDVLVNGNRITDANEHDCIVCGHGSHDVTALLDIDTCNLHKDYSYIENRSNYVPGKTVIYNAYQSVYVFSEFPSDTSDPFGKIVSLETLRSKCSNAPSSVGRH